MQHKKKKRMPEKVPRDFDGDAERTTNTVITQHTETQGLNEEAKRELEKDVESAKSADPILVTIRGNAQGKKHTLKDGETILGRSRSADVRILDPSVSGKHARILRNGKRVFLEDLNSNNGTFVNNELVTSVLLQKEDMVTLGTTVLKFVPAGELEILYHGNLIKAAYIDHLTGIYNHQYIVEALDAEFKRARALGAKLSLIIIDLDKFKNINDTYGHTAGDFVLREFCNLVRSQALRSSEIFGRYGGDEFMILLWNTSSAEAGTVAERIRELVASYSFSYEGQDLEVTVSLGVACVGPANKNAKDFFNNADKALYGSKAKGRNCITIFES